MGGAVFTNLCGSLEADYKYLLLGEALISSRKGR
jgi:hypothetical protein